MLSGGITKVTRVQPDPRLIGLEQLQIGLSVRAHFRRKKTGSVNDVYFVKKE
jgi:hypothetical protein